MIRLLLIIPCILTLSGCLYSHITVPYSTNFEDSAIGSKKMVLDERLLTEPLTGLQISVEWSEDLIRSEAQKAGISQISYVDREIFRIIFGIYTHRKLIVYGD